MADETFYIPMVGFVQSFNVSVAAAITLYHASAAHLAKVRIRLDSGYVTR